MESKTEIVHATATILRRLREEAKYSQEELAARSEVSRSMIDKYERRERLPSLDILLRLAKGLKLEAHQILKLIEHELKKPSL